MDDEKDNDISSIAGLESNIKYLEIYENSTLCLIFSESNPFEKSTLQIVSNISL